MFKYIPLEIRNFFQQKLRADMLTANHNIAELLWATKFNSLSQDIPWFIKRSLASSGAAANYSFLYALFWILEFIRPKDILEMGAGQSSLITGQYVANNSFVQELVLVEHNHFWLEQVQNRLPLCEKIKYRFFKKMIHIHKGQESSFYEGITESLEGKKFDFIILDGPERSDRFGRVGFASLLPHSLAEKFIILIDDYDSATMQESAKFFETVLLKNEIQFDSSVFAGSKSQLLIFSPEYIFLKTI